MFRCVLRRGKFFGSEEPGSKLNPPVATIEANHITLVSDHAALRVLKFQPKRVSAAEFKRHYALVGMAQTMYAHTYLGERNGRAYINVGSLSILGDKWSDEVIYVELSQLDTEFRQSLPKKEMKETL